MRTIDDRFYIPQGRYGTFMSTSVLHRVIAANLDRMLQAVGWTRERLATKIRTGKSTLTATMNPESNQPPTTRTVERISEALKVPAWQILLPDAPADRHRAKELERLVAEWVKGNSDVRPDPVADLPADEAELLEAYRRLPAGSRDGLIALLGGLSGLDQPYAPLAPPGGLQAPPDGEAPAARARSRERG